MIDNFSPPFHPNCRCSYDFNFPIDDDDDDGGIEEIQTCLAFILFCYFIKRISHRKTTDWT